MVYIILGKGFEEAEALVPCDILRRGGVEVAMAGIGGVEIEGAHSIKVTADCVAEDTDLAAGEMIVIPGGMGGVNSIMASAAVMASLKPAYEQGKKLAAICAGPMVLTRAGVLEGKRAVCYPGLESELSGAFATQESPVITDGSITTGRGPGAAYDFGFALLEILKGKEAADKTAADMCYARS